MNNHKYAIALSLLFATMMSGVAIASEDDEITKKLIINYMTQDMKSEIENTAFAQLEDSVAKPEIDVTIETMPQAPDNVSLR